MFFWEKHLRFSSREKVQKHGQRFVTWKKNTLVEFLFFFSSPALPLRCVPGKGAQKGPTISMKSLANHIAQHEYLITLSTYGLQALMEDGYLEGVPREVGTSEISGKSGVQRMFLFQGEN